MGTLPTVKIQSKSGYIVINESDFDRRNHKLYKEPIPAPAEKKEEDKATSKKAKKEDKPNEDK